MEVGSGEGCIISSEVTGKVIEYGMDFPVVADGGVFVTLPVLSSVVCLGVGTTFDSEKICAVVSCDVVDDVSDDVTTEVGSGEGCVISSEVTGEVIECGTDFPVVTDAGVFVTLPVQNVLARYI